VPFSHEGAPKGVGNRPVLGVLRVVLLFLTPNRGSLAILPARGFHKDVKVSAPIARVVSDMILAKTLFRRLRKPAVVHDKDKASQLLKLFGNGVGIFVDISANDRCAGFPS
jgi:hypothetical protein